jgi:uncharacterized protein (DUF697 family)
MALPALLSGLGRQLIVQGAKGAAKGAAKKMLSGKAKERNNNSIVKRQESPKVGYKKSSALVPVSKSINFGSPPSSPEVSSSTKGADGSLLTIKEKVIRIENLLGEQYKNRKKQAEKQRKLSERAGRKEKEELLEKTPQEKKNKGKFNIPIPGKGLFDNLMSRVFNFLFWVAIGKMLPTIIKFLPQIMGFLKVIGKVMDAVINVAGFILDGFITFVDFGFKVYDKIRGFAGAIGGEGLVKVLDGFTSAVETLLNLLFIISMASAVGGGFGGGKGGRKGGGQTPGTRPGQGLRPKVTTTGGRGAGTPDIRNPLRTRPNVSVSGGGTAGRPNIRNPLRTRPNITTGAGKALASEAAEKITKKTALLAAGKFILPFTKRIPIFGPIVDFVISVALGESVGRAATRAIGAGLGSWAGIPIGAFLAGAAGSVVPIVGTLLGGAVGGSIGGIIGGLLGDYVGGWLYDTVVGGNNNPNKPSPKTNKKETETQKLQEGGEVQEEDKNLEYDPKTGKVKRRKIRIPDISQAAKDNKDVSKVYTSEGAKKIIDLANSVKDVPIIGSSMFSALNLALGNKPDQMLTRAIAYDLMSFSNLDSFENLSGSFSKLNALVSMEGGGEVKRLVSLNDSDFETSVQTLSIFLGKKINNEKVQKITEQDKIEASKNAWWDPLGLFSGSGGEDISYSGGITGPAGTSGDKLTMARNLMRVLGLTSEQAAGIVGNMDAESGVENARPQGSSPGTKAPLKVDGKTGYGLVQWTSRGRQQALYDFAKSKGDDLSKPLSMNTEYQFFLKEFRGEYRNVLNEIKNAPDAKTSSTIFMQKYERPAGYRTQAKIDERWRFTKPIVEALKDGQGTATEGSETFIPGQIPTADSSSDNMGDGSKLAGQLGRFIKSKLKSPENFSQVHRHPEHPPYSLTSGHRANSYHYKGRALDIGAWTHEQQPILDAISQFNRKTGSNPVELLHGINDPSGNHDNHVHVAYEGGGLIRPRSSMSVPDSFTSYNSPSANTKVVMVPIAVPVSKPQMSPVLENSMGGFVEFGEVNSMGSRMNSIHQTSRS